MLFQVMWLRLKCSKIVFFMASHCGDHNYEGVPELY